LGKKQQATPDEIQLVSAPWQDVLAVCRKCGKKMKGGFGPKNKQSLPDLLKQHLRATGRRQALRVLEVGCLGLCPKNGVTAIQGSQPGRMLVLPRGLDAERVTRELGLVPLLGVETAPDA
jgi:predicted metal-binding protein